jgi:hypothetical protein
VEAPAFGPGLGVAAGDVQDEAEKAAVLVLRRVLGRWDDIGRCELKGRLVKGATENAGDGIVEFVYP